MTNEEKIKKTIERIDKLKAERTKIEEEAKEAQAAVDVDWQNLNTLQMEAHLTDLQTEVQFRQTYVQGVTFAVQTEQQ